MNLKQLWREGRGGEGERSKAKPARPTDWLPVNVNNV